MPPARRAAARRLRLYLRAASEGAAHAFGVGRDMRACRGARVLCQYCRPAVGAVPEDRRGVLRSVSHAVAAVGGGQVCRIPLVSALKDAVRRAASRCDVCGSPSCAALCTRGRRIRVVPPVLWGAVFAKRKAEADVDTCRVVSCRVEVCFRIAKTGGPREAGV